jgi:hypothetical protein
MPLVSRCAERETASTTVNQQPPQLMREPWGVARSNLAEQARARPEPRRPHRKTGDADLLPVLRRLADERPTYGYRRLTAILNRRAHA